MPFTANPRVIYRGMGAALTNEMGQMGLQFGVTGFLMKFAPPSDAPNPVFQMGSAMGGGLAVAPFASVIECTMIQQQRQCSCERFQALRLPEHTSREYLTVRRPQALRHPEHTSRKQLPGRPLPPGPLDQYP